MRKKGATRDSNQGPLGLQARSSIITTASGTMYNMVSGHHSNTFSWNQRRQSRFLRVKSPVLIHSACPYKNYAPKSSQPPPPVNYFFLLFST